MVNSFDPLSCCCLLLSAVFNNHINVAWVLMKVRTPVSWTKLVWFFFSFFVSCSAILCSEKFLYRWSLLGRSLSFCCFCSKHWFPKATYMVFLSSFLKSFFWLGEGHDNSHVRRGFPGIATTNVCAYGKFHLYPKDSEILLLVIYDHIRILNFIEEYLGLYPI